MLIYLIRQGTSGLLQDRQVPGGHGAFASAPACFRIGAKVAMRRNTILLGEEIRLFLKTIYRIETIFSQPIRNHKFLVESIWCYKQVSSCQIRTSSQEIKKIHALASSNKLINNGLGDLVEEIHCFLTFH
jgi:hypothetical protein